MVVVQLDKGSIKKKVTKPPDSIVIEQVYEPKDFILLDITAEHLKIMHSYYLKVEKPNCDMIEVKELLKSIDIRSTPFTNRLFCSIGKRSRGLLHLDFKLFVFLTWNYCTLDSNDLGMP